MNGDDSGLHRVECAYVVIRLVACAVWYLACVDPWSVLDQDGGTALMSACSSGHLSVARWLVDEKGVDVNATSTVS